MTRTLIQTKQRINTKLVRGKKGKTQRIYFLRKTFKAEPYTISILKHGKQILNVGETWIWTPQPSVYVDVNLERIDPVESQKLYDYAVRKGVTESWIQKKGKLKGKGKDKTVYMLVESTEKSKPKDRVTIIVLSTLGDLRRKSPDKVSQRENVYKVYLESELLPLISALKRDLHNQGLT